RIVLYSDGEIIEPRLLVITSEIAKLVKPVTDRFRQRNRDGTVSRAFDSVATHRQRRADSLSSQSVGIDLDRVGSLAFDDRACGDGPVVNRSDVCRHTAGIARRKC